MPDFLKDVAGPWLKETLRDEVAHDVTYARKHETTITGLKATIGRQVYRSIDPDTGRSILFRSDCDFIVDPALIDFGSGPTDPLPGDRVTDGTETFEATELNGEPCWRPCDRLTGLIRIHTIQV